MRVEYFDMRHLAGRNGGIIVTVGPWPARVLQARGWTEQRRIWSRLATAHEEAEVKASPRCMSWRYETVEGLIEDESATPGVTKEEVELLRFLLGRGSRAAA